MNSKFNFLQEKPLIPKDIISLYQEKFSDSVVDIQTGAQKYFYLKNDLIIKWEQLIKNKEYLVSEGVEEEMSIMTKTNTTLVTLRCSKETAENIVELMNMAHREGAKQIIELFKSL
jgi:hypothetical protein